jgi:hypothetical protein
MPLPNVKFPVCQVSSRLPPGLKSYQRSMCLRWKRKLKRKHLYVQGTWRPLNSGPGTYFCHASITHSFYWGAIISSFTSPHISAFLLFIFVALGFELRAHTRQALLPLEPLHQPFLVTGIFKIVSPELIALVGFKPWSSWFLPPERLGL